MQKLVIITFTFEMFIFHNFVQKTDFEQSQF